MISIIIPTYNEDRTIEKLIDNLNKNIDIEEYEIIIVDDFFK